MDLVKLSLLFLTFIAKTNQRSQTITLFKGPSNQLTEFLLRQHNKAAPPDGVVEVNYDLELVHILDLDELKQRITVLLYIQEIWEDRTLSWDPTHFFNLTKTWLPEESIWLPDILVFNMLNHDNLLHSVRAPVVIQHTGRVTFTFPAVYTVMCKIDIKHFPLDEQHCALEIASWEYGVEKLRLSTSSASNPLQHYSENEEWELKNISSNTQQYHHEDFHVQEIFFNIDIKRKPLFYICNLVVPSFIITTLSIIGLFSPSISTGERQEKFTLGVTAILTMSVLLMLVTEKVPHSSSSVPLLVVYFTTDILLITGGTAATALLMLVHNARWDTRTYPVAILLRIFCIPPQHVDYREMKNDSERDEENSLEKLPTQDILVLVTKMLYSIRSQLSSMNDDKNEQQKREPPTKKPLVLLAQRLDFLCMGIFMFINLVFTLYLVAIG